MRLCLLCGVALFAAVAPLRRTNRTKQHQQCPGPLATGSISSTTHAQPVEGSELYKMAFGSCYKPASQTSSSLWRDVRSFLPGVFVWLGDNMYWDGPNVQRKREAYNTARDDTYYTAHGPPASPKIPVAGTWDDHDFADNNNGKHYQCKRETQDEFVHHFSIPATDPRHQDFAGEKQEGVYSSVMYTKPSETPQPTPAPVPTPAPPTPAPSPTPAPVVGETTCGGNAGGAACVFPFVYDGATYDSCTEANNEQPWCYTTNTGQWGNCHCGLQGTCGGNAGGAPCQFPMSYEGSSHDACILTGHDQPWCYTTSESEPGPWGNCACPSSLQEQASSSLQEQASSSNGVHLINLDTRYFRSPTFTTYGACEGAASEMLGETQWAWLDAELARPSDVKVISSAIQVLPPLAPLSGYGGFSRPKSEYCTYDGAGQTFDSAIARLNETGRVGTHYEAWNEMPVERERLLRKCQKAMNDGKAKAIIFISGDQHWAEIMAKVMPADPVYGPSQVLHEVTASGIEQWWDYPIVNDNRLSPDAGPEFNAITTHTSGMGSSSNCPPHLHHVCNSRSNYGQIEVDFWTSSLYLRIKTPHEADPTASEVKVSLA